MFNSVKNRKAGRELKDERVRSSRSHALGTLPGDSSWGLPQGTLPGEFMTPIEVLIIGSQKIIHNLGLAPINEVEKSLEHWLVLI